MIRKTWVVLLYCVPVFLMIGFIPFVLNDYLLAIIYLFFITALLVIRSEKNDLLVLVIGFVVITISELFFVSTGVETFTRNTLFGLIPIWLPLLWAYAFVTIKRSLGVLDK